MLFAANQEHLVQWKSEKSYCSGAYIYIEQTQLWETIHALRAVPFGPSVGAMARSDTDGSRISLPPVLCRCYFGLQAEHPRKRLIVRAFMCSDIVNPGIEGHFDHALICMALPSCSEDAADLRKHSLSRCCAAFRLDSI